MRKYFIFFFIFICFSIYANENIIINNNDASSFGFILENKTRYNDLNYRLENFPSINNFNFYLDKPLYAANSKNTKKTTITKKTSSKDKLTFYYRMSWFFVPGIIIFSAGLITMLVSGILGLTHSIYMSTFWIILGVGLGVSLIGIPFLAIGVYYSYLWRKAGGKFSLFMDSDISTVKVSSGIRIKLNF